MKPILLHYYVTYRCNARCSFCNICEGEREATALTIEKVERNLRAAKRMGVQFADFTGGEPLLFRHLPKALEMAKGLGLWTSVTSNGLLYPKRARELAGLVDLMHFSLDSMDREEHNRIRGVQCYDHVMESLEIAQTLGERPDILFTVTSENMHTLPQMVAFAQSRRLILIVNPVFSYFGNPGIPPREASYLRQFWGEPYVYLNTAFIKLLEEGGNDIHNPRCRAVDAAIVISPDDEVLLPCYHLHNQRVPINGGLEQALQSPQVAEARRMQGRYDFCQGCTINCYFDPSFLYKMDGFFFSSLVSKAKYGVDKYLRAYLEH